MSVTVVCQDLQVLQSKRGGGRQTGGTHPPLLNSLVRGSLSGGDIQAEPRLTPCIVKGTLHHIARSPVQQMHTLYDTHKTVAALCSTCTHYMIPTRLSRLH